MHDYIDSEDGCCVPLSADPNTLINEWESQE